MDVEKLRELRKVLTALINAQEVPAGQRRAQKRDQLLAEASNLAELGLCLRVHRPSDDAAVWTHVRSLLACMPFGVGCELRPADVKTMHDLVAFLGQLRDALEAHRAGCLDRDAELEKYREAAGGIGWLLKQAKGGP